ncbi:calcium,calmodulin-dependent protein kinase, partial [Sarracenia purpurea var. burkii]
SSISAGLPLSLSPPPLCTSPRPLAALRPAAAEIRWQRFGIVYRCSSAVSDDSFACKSIDKCVLADTIDRECIDKEPKILQLLSGHPNILQIYRVFEDENFLHMVTDLCESVDLCTHILLKLDFLKL